MRVALFPSCDFQSALRNTLGSKPVAFAMASWQVAARTPAEALQKSLEEEKVAHLRCQRRFETLTMELHLLQRKNGDLEQQLAEEQRSHEYFKSRLATVKAKTCVPKAETDAMLAEIAALAAEKEAWLAEKQMMTTKLNKCAKDGETAASCRVALMSALAQSQQELEAKKDELAKNQAEANIIQERVPECTICFENTASIAFGPCGHVCACTKCCSDLHECPLCRAVVSTKMKLHFA